MYDELFMTKQDKLSLNDTMYKAKETPRFGHELYGDSMFTKQNVSYDSDPPEFSPFKSTNDTLSNLEKMRLTNNVDMEHFLYTVQKEMGKYEWLPYMRFSVYFELNGINQEIAKNLNTILVHRNYLSGLISPTEKVMGLLFIPFELFPFKTPDDVIAINKVYLDNISNPSVQHQICGTFRRPVPVTRNENHVSFDHTNCAVYNDDYFMIRMVTSASNFCKK